MGLGHIVGAHWPELGKKTVSKSLPHRGENSKYQDAK